MKIKLIRFSFLIGFCLALAACGGSVRLPEQLDAFVDNAEQRSSSYDAEDWQRSIKKYETLVEEYTSSKVQYTESEKQLAARAMGRYHALLVKNGIEQSAAYLKELEKLVPSYLEGLVDGLEESAGSIKESLKGLIMDDGELEPKMEDLGNRLEEFFDDLEEDLE